MSKTAMKMLSAIIALSCAGAASTISVSADTAETSGIIYGDANCDESVDIRDVAAVKKHIVKLSTLSEKGVENCDFFGTGEISVKNLGQLVKYSIKTVDKLGPVAEQETEVNFSVVFANSEASHDIGKIKVYKSAEELHKDFPSEDFAQYDDEYFSSNVLCIQGICVNSMAKKVVVDSVEENADGNFTVTIKETFESYPVTSEGLLGYVVCMEMSADAYKGQTFDCKTTEEAINNNYNFRISDYGMNMYDESAVCTTYEELCDFVEKNYHPWNPDAESEVLKIYDEKFFENNVLFISGYSKDSGLMEPVFDYISVTDEEITLGMIRDYSMEGVVEDLNGYTVSFSMSKDEYKGQKFTVKSKNLNQNDVYDHLCSLFDYSADEPDENIAPVVCTSYEELTAYVEKYKSAQPDLMNDKDSVHIINTYDEEFFEEYVLCIDRLPVTRGRQEIVFDSVEYVGDSIILYYDRNERASENKLYSSCFASIAVSKDTYKGQDFRTGFIREKNNGNENENANPTGAYVLPMNYSGYPGYSMNVNQPYAVTSYRELKDYLDRFTLRKYTTGGDAIEQAYENEELLKKYDDEFFKDNVLFIEAIEFNYDGDVAAKSIDKDSDGNFILNVDYKSNDDCVIKPCFVGFTLPKSEYSNQTFTVNVKEIELPQEKANPTNAFAMQMNGYNFYLYENMEKPYVITSYREFKEYTDSFVTRVYLTGEDVTDIEISSAEELVEKYNAEFFEDNVLFVDAVYGSSMTAKSVSQDNDGNFVLNIDVEYFESVVPIAYFVGFELPKSEYSNQTFTVNLIEKTSEIQEEPAIYNFVSVMTGYNSDIDYKSEVLRKTAYTSAEEFHADYPKMTKYDEEFFKNNVLYLTYEYLPSGSITVAGKSVETDENGNFILNIYDVAPACQTCDCNGCVVGFKLPRSEYNGQTLEKVVHYDAPYEYYDEAYKGETEGELFSGNLINTDDYVNVMGYHVATVYNAETIKSADELKNMINENADETEKSALLEKYNEEFFKNYDIAVVKFASPATTTYLAEDATVIGGYNNYDGSSVIANVQIGTAPFGGSENAEDYCIILKFAKDDNVSAVNVEFCQICVDPD